MQIGREFHALCDIKQVRGSSFNNELLWNLLSLMFHNFNQMIKLTSIVCIRTTLYKESFKMFENKTIIYMIRIDFPGFLSHFATRKINMWALKKW